MGSVEPFISLYLNHDPASVFEKNDFYISEITHINPPSDIYYTNGEKHTEQYKTEEIKSVHYFIWVLYRTY